MKKPDFIIIGAMKAGTTSLHGFLDLHPELSMSRAKEINYFNNHFFSKDRSWYENQFSKTLVSGEATPAYSWTHIYPEVPERIHSFNPDIKIIYLLRDPIDRIISHLHHDLYRDRITSKDLPTILFEDPHYINSSKYWFQIRNYLKYFNREDICFIQTENLKNKPLDTLNIICDFLKISPFNSDVTLKNRNTGEKRYLIKQHDFIHKNFSKKLAKFFHWIFYFMNIKIDRPQLSTITIDRLKFKLREDIGNLEKEFQSDIDFDKWKNFKPDQQ